MQAWLLRLEQRQIDECDLSLASLNLVPSYAWTAEVHTSLANIIYPMSPMERNL
jgi:hypothetical protein